MPEFDSIPAKSRNPEILFLVFGTDGTQNTFLTLEV